jgi:hypothetical protein
MALFAATSLRDIKNVEAFVVDCIKRSGIRPRDYEWEDVVGDSILLLYDMESKYVEQMDGYKQKGLFSGYAITYLPRKIKAAYHKSQENHLMCTQPDGSRKWEYRARSVSYDAVTSRNEEVTPLDERTIRTPGNFIDPPSLDTRNTGFDGDPKFVSSSVDNSDPEA